MDLTLLLFRLLLFTLLLFTQLLFRLLLFRLLFWLLLWCSCVGSTKNPRILRDIVTRPCVKFPCYKQSYSAVQSQKAVTAYFSSKQLLPFGFAEYDRACFVSESCNSLLKITAQHILQPKSDFAHYKSHPYKKHWLQGNYLLGRLGTIINRCFHRTSICYLILFRITQWFCPMLFKCWPTAEDGGPTFEQHCTGCMKIQVRLHETKQMAKRQSPTLNQYWTEVNAIGYQRWASVVRSLDSVNYTFKMLTLM